MSPARRLLSLALVAVFAAVGGFPVHAPSAVAQDRKADGKKRDGKKDEAKKDETKKETPKKEEAKKRLDAGDEVKDLSMDLVAGGSWTASSERGKAIVIVFASEFSSESLDALKTLGDAKGKTGKSGAAVLGVLRDADAEKAKKVVKDNSLTVRLALDPKRKAYDKLAKAGLPWTVIIDRNGKIAQSTSGFDDDSIARKIEELGKK